MPYGGNLDDRRIGIGATMYYPVAVKGGLLSMGDTHLAQGDGELDGTAIETSITGLFKITLIKGAGIGAWKEATVETALGGMLKGLDFPLLENANEYVVHGFSYKNYLTELGYATVKDDKGVDLPYDETQPVSKYTDRSKAATSLGLGIYGKSSIDRATGVCVCVCVCVFVCVTKMAHDYLCSKSSYTSHSTK